MVQAGLNLGPRHQRVFGYAKSFTKKLSDAQMVSEDNDIIGAASIFWELAQAVLPKDVVGPILECIADENLPSLATRNVKPGDILQPARETFWYWHIIGQGFSLTIDDTVYEFPFGDRAPLEVYLVCGYNAW
jgi:hypothetical protein